MLKSEQVKAVINDIRERGGDSIWPHEFEIMAEAVHRLDALTKALNDDCRKWEQLSMEYLGVDGLTQARQRLADLINGSIVAPNEKAACAMLDVFWWEEQSVYHRRALANVTLSCGDALALAEWISEVLKLRGDRS